MPVIKSVNLHVIQADITEWLWSWVNERLTPQNSVSVEDAQANS